jgi:CBS domain containing-hemolysin-like protein
MLVFLLENIVHFLMMVFLLFCSAFFSGSETAFFNISAQEAKLLKKSHKPLERFVGDILGSPKKLLSCLLFSNMAVNTLFFAFSSVFIINISKQFSAFSGIITAFICFIMLIIFGEMLPKSFAFGNSVLLSSAAVLPCMLLVKVLNPIISILDVIFFMPLLRLCGAYKQNPESINYYQLKALLKSSLDDGLITVEETYLFNEIVEFGLLKVHQIMQARVDMASCGIDSDISDIKKMMRENNLRYLPMYESNIDNIKGYLDLRDILLCPDRQIKDYLKPVVFVPEQKTLESMLVYFQKNKTDMAIVVDEYGGISGRIDIETIIGELFGAQPQQNEQTEPVCQIGPMKYRLNGNIALHDWKDAFGINPEELNIATVGGFITACLGKIPSKGDKIKLGNIDIEVESVYKHRIKTLILSFANELEE